METNTKNTKAILFKKTFGVFLIILFLFLLFPQPVNGHLTPGDNYDGRGRLYGLNSGGRGQGGENNNCGGRRNKGGDPVDTATGEFTESVTDLSILGRIPIEVRRTFRSQRQHYSSCFGANWFFTYDYRLRKLKDGNLVVTFPSGDERVFEAKGGGRYGLCCGDTTIITENKDGTYTLKPRGFRSYVFDGHGNLIRLQESSGDALHFVYSKKRRAIHGHFRYSAKGQVQGVLALRRMLKEIRDDWGRYIRFTYYEDNKRGGRVKNITFMAGTEHAVTVTYDYDDEGNLISVTGPATPQHPNGTTTRYTYSSGHASPILDHNLISITAPKEVAAGKGPYLENKYDENDRVVAQKYGRGTLYFTYSQQGDNRVTTVKDRAGDIRTTFFDKRGNVIKDVIKGRKLRPQDPAEYVFTYEYDEKTGHLVKAVNPSGSLRTHRCDDRGNIIETRRKEKDGPDSDNDVVSRFTYEKQYDRLKTYTDPLGRKTIYDYDYEEASRGDLNGDGITNQKFGQLIRVTYPPANPGEKTPVYLYRYNSHGQFISSTDPLGRINHIEYYEKGLSGGRVHRFVNDVKGVAATRTLEYDALGNVTASTDANGNTTRFAVDAYGHITRSIASKPFEYKTDYFYDENGNLTRIDIENKGPEGKIDPKNPVITFISEYDLLDNLVAEKTEIGMVSADVVKAAKSSSKDVLVTRMVYDVDDRLQEVIHPAGEKEQYKYDERGLVLRRIMVPGTPEEAITHYTYSLDGYLTHIKDVNGNITQFRLDGHNRLQEAVDPVGNRLVREYDRVGNLVKQEIYDTNGKLLSRKEWEYDGRDRVKMEHIHFFSPDGQPLKDGPLTAGDGRVSTAYEYDLVGNPVRITDDNKDAFQYAYDGLGRMVKETDPLGNSTTYTFDKTDNMLTMQKTDKHPEGKPDIVTTFRYVYDALNRLKKTVDPLGNITTFSYDSRGNLVFRKDANGDGLGLVYDSLSRLSLVEQEMRDENGTVIKSLKESYQYHGKERFASITDDNGNTTTFFYNALGLLVKTKYADGSVLTMTKDGIGNMLEHIGPRGIKTTYTYTKDNLLRTAAAGSRVETFTYDGMGRMLSAEVTEKGKKTSSISWEYDSMGNPISTIQDGKRISRSFSGEGSLVKFTFPDREAITITYDPLQRIKSIKRGTRRVTDYIYVGADRVFRQQFGNNTYLSREYNQTRQTIKNVSGMKGVAFDGIEYQYSPVGQRIAEKRLLRPGLDTNIRFKYDSAGRLEAAHYQLNENNKPAAKSFLFELDGVGNRISQTVNETKTLFNHDAAGQYRPDPLNRYTDIQGQKREHDAAGNVTFDGRFHYVYDHENRVVEVQEPGSKKTIASYTYDALGRRISKQTADGTTVFLYDGFQVIAEYNGDGTLEVRYVYGNRTDEILRMEHNGQIYTYHRDIQGNITNLTDELGNVVEAYTYDPFGGVTIRDADGNKLSQSKVGNPYFFTGRRLDSETGLYYYRFRMYDPVTGRFLQHDPLGFFQGANRYQYTAGDPINLVDPMGLYWGESFVNKYVKPAWEETKIWGEAVTYLPGEVASSFMDGRAHDSLQGFAYNYGGKHLGMSNRPTYGHTKAFKGGKKIANITKEVQKAVIINYATGSLGNVMKGAKVFQVCSKGGRIARYAVVKVIDAGMDTAAEYIMDENGNCWTAEEFLKRFGKNALISVLGDAAAATLAKLKGSKKSFIENAEEFAAGKSGCFTGGTLVAAENGLKPIEEIKVGEKVWAMDPETGETRLKKVLDAYLREVDRLYTIKVEGETITITMEHPLWITGKGWVDAKDVLEGDTILTKDGLRHDVQKITVSPGKFPVYNLTVDGFHTYLVSGIKVVAHDNIKTKTPGKNKPMAMGSLAAGTLAHTPDGKKPIENLVVGDVILASTPGKNNNVPAADAKEKSGHDVYKVTQIYDRIVPAVYELKFGEEMIIAASEHQFWLENKGWTEACELKVGDISRTLSGGQAVLQNIRKIYGSFNVYSIEVANIHTYHIGHQGILVHNTSPTQPLYRETFSKVGMPTGAISGTYDKITKNLEIHQINVFKEYQGQGCGRELYRKLFNEVEGEISTVTGELAKDNLKTAKMKGYKKTHHVKMLNELGYTEHKYNDITHRIESRKPDDKICK